MFPVGMPLRVIADVVFKDRTDSVILSMNGQKFSIKLPPYCYGNRVKENIMAVAIAKTYAIERLSSLNNVEQLVSSVYSVELSNVVITEDSDKPNVGTLFNKEAVM